MQWLCAIPIIRNNNIRIDDVIMLMVFIIFIHKISKVFMSTIWTTNTKIIHNIIEGNGSIVCLINSVKLKTH